MKLGLPSFFARLLGRKRETTPHGVLYLGPDSSGRASISIDESTLRSHLFMSGRAGSGVDRLLEQMLTQQIAQGRGWIYLDHHVDNGLVERLAEEARAHGRTADFLVLDLLKPDSSRSYAVLRHGTPEQRAVRLLQLLPAAERHKGAERYMDAAFSVLVPLFAALDATGKNLNLRDLAALIRQLGDEVLLKEYLSSLPDGNEARAALLAAIESATKQMPLEHMLGGLAGRLHLLSTLELANVLESEAPDVVMADVFANNKMLFVRLPFHMQQDSVMQSLARLVVHDAITSVFSRMATPRQLRQQFHFVMTGFPAYGLASHTYAAVKSEAYSHARAMQVTLVPVTEVGWDKLVELSDQGARILCGNTFSKIYFSQEQDSVTGELHPDLPAYTLNKLAPGEFVVWKGADYHHGRLCLHRADRSARGG